IGFPVVGPFEISQTALALTCESGCASRGIIDSWRSITNSGKKPSTSNARKPSETRPKRDDTQTFNPPVRMNQVAQRILANRNTQRQNQRRIAYQNCCFTLYWWL